MTFQFENSLYHAEKSLLFSVCRFMAFLAVQNLSAILKLKVILQFSFIDAAVFAISAVLHRCVEMGNLLWLCIIIHKFIAIYKMKPEDPLKIFQPLFFIYK